MIRKITLISIIAGILLGFSLIPASAMSSLANDFLRACTALDSPFPPRGWVKADVHDAALEVLDEIEAGNYDKWPLDFCLKALGYAGYPEDLDRILKYEKEMNNSVLRSLRGFSTPKATDLLIKYLSDKEATKRELAAWGLSEMNFKKFDKPDVWRDKVLKAIRNARGKEKTSWLKKDYDKVIETIEESTESN